MALIVEFNVAWILLKASRCNLMLSSLTSSLVLFLVKDSIIAGRLAGSLEADWTFNLSAVDVELVSVVVTPGPRQMVGST